MQRSMGSQSGSGGGYNGDDNVRLLEFLLAGNVYAIPISKVSGIVEMREIMRLPRGPEAIDGVTDLRGEITAVLNPKKVLDVEDTDTGRKKGHILVLDRPDDKQKVGVRVDDVLRVSSYPEDRIDENGELSEIETRSMDDDLIRGIVRDGENDDTELIAWIDVDEILENVH